MNPRMQQQLEHFKKVTSHQKASGETRRTSNNSYEDSLSKAIRTEEDGKRFMANLKSVLEKSK
ncbi:hypothetical protein ACUN24_14365 [Pedobacter sp. WC2501]|uniref:hypothetical protein n=1 Tax=Pedobacter sp. WC2501 TaxID=3461400 RepID=UPI00404591EB